MKTSVIDKRNPVDSLVAASRQLHTKTYSNIVDIHPGLTKTQRVSVLSLMETYPLLDIARLSREKQVIHFLNQEITFPMYGNVSLGVAEKEGWLISVNSYSEKRDRGIYFSSSSPEFATESYPDAKNVLALVQMYHVLNLSQNTNTRYTSGIRIPRIPEAIQDTLSKNPDLVLFKDLRLVWGPLEVISVQETAANNADPLIVGSPLGIPDLTLILHHWDINGEEQKLIVPE